MFVYVRFLQVFNSCFKCYYIVFHARERIVHFVYHFHEKMMFFSHDLLAYREIISQRCSSSNKIQSIRYRRSIVIYVICLISLLAGIILGSSCKPAEKGAAVILMA